MLNSAPVKIARLLAHIYWGIFQALLVLPISKDLEPRRLRWSKRLLAILRIECRVVGQLPAPGQGVVLASNHISWLDIYALLALLPTRFISKAEVRGWPLVGRLAKAVGTLFIERNKRSDTHRINQEMAAHLRAGECLAFFPEGTTTDGGRLLPFYPSLFQPAVDAGAPVVPVTLRYLNPQGEPCTDAAYHGDMSLGASLMNIARLRGLQVEIRFLPAIDANGYHRRELAQHCEAAIRADLGFSEG